jgi:hypothetical protein
VSVTGLSVYAAGTLVIGVAKLVVVGALFAFFSIVTDSSRVGAIAAVIYMTNANFVYEGSQFAYESLALPLAAALLVLMADTERRKWVLICGLLAVSVVVSHHLTTAGLFLMLLAWLAVAALASGELRQKTTRVRPAVAAGLVLVASILWLAAAAPSTFDYLTPRFGDALSEFGAILGGSTPREAFASGVRVAPTAERIITVLSVVLTVSLIPVGAVYAWRRRHVHPLIPILILAAALYPLSILLRLTQAGQEAASRAPEFLYLGVAAVAAVATATWALRSRLRPVIAGGITFVFLGGFMLGFAFYARFPGSYRVSAGPRSIDDVGVSAAKWSGTVLGHGNRVAGDRFGAKLLGAYGLQDPVSALADRVNVGPLYLSRTLDGPARAVLRRGRIAYVLVDRRLLNSLPYDGLYIEGGEPKQRLTAADLAKFERAGFSRIFDNGAIQVFSVPLAYRQQTARDGS